MVVIAGSRYRCYQSGQFTLDHWPMYQTSDQHPNNTRPADLVNWTTISSDLTSRSKSTDWCWFDAFPTSHTMEKDYVPMVAGIMANLCPCSPIVTPPVDWFTHLITWQCRLATWLFIKRSRVLVTCTINRQATNPTRDQVNQPYVMDLLTFW